jgi:hypothetical protein
VILIEVVAAVLLALGSVLIIRALIVADIQEPVAAERLETVPDQQQAA